MKTGQIVAMGGGGFSMEPEHLVLDQWLLSLCASERPAVCFLPTASGDAEGYIERFYDAFHTLACAPSHLALFRRESTDLETYLLSQELVYVGGGNTVNMLAVWRAHGVDVALRKALASGVVLAGLSAGSLCWFEGGVTDSYGGGLQPLCDGLGFLSGSHCPHYDGEASRRPVYQQSMERGVLAAGYAADDGAALYFRDGQLHEIVSSRADAAAYRVELREGVIHEERLTARLLG